MGILRADISESGLQSDTVQHPGLALTLPRFYIYEDLLPSGQNPARGPAFYLGEKSPGCSQHQELCQEQQQGHQEGAGPPWGFSAHTFPSYRILGTELIPGVLQTPATSRRSPGRDLYSKTSEELLPASTKLRKGSCFGKLDQGKPRPVCSEDVGRSPQTSPTAH